MLVPRLPYRRYSFNAVVFRPRTTPTLSGTPRLWSLMTEAYDVGRINSCDDGRHRLVIWYGAKHFSSSSDACYSLYSVSLPPCKARVKWTECRTNVSVCIFHVCNHSRDFDWILYWKFTPIYVIGFKAWFKFYKNGKTKLYKNTDTFCIHACS
jgi:hypothetical protein